MKHEDRPPDSLVKYMRAEHALRVIESRSLKVSYFPDANDPFEGIPATPPRPQPTAAEIRALLSDLKAVHQMYEALSRLDPSIPKQHPTPESWAARAIEMVGELEQTGTPGMMASTTGFISFSESRCDPLLWSHYADWNRGVGIVFNPRPLQSAVTYSVWKRIRYQQERIRIPFPPTPQVDPFEVMLSLQTTKGTHWSYEREWRLLFPHPDYPKIRDTRSTRLEFVEFPSKSVLGVILGSRFSHCEVRDQLLSAIKDSFPQAALHQAVPHQTQYQIDIKELA